MKKIQRDYIKARSAFESIKKTKYALLDPYHSLLADGNIDEYVEKEMEVEERINFWKYSDSLADTEQALINWAIECVKIDGRTARVFESKKIDIEKVRTCLLPSIRKPLVEMCLKLNPDI